eukprot:752476-Hanusia_phi.AAC.2
MYPIGSDKASDSAGTQCESDAFPKFNVSVRSDGPSRVSTGSQVLVAAACEPQRPQAPGSDSPS